MLSDNKCDLTLRDKKIVLPLDKGHFITGFDVKRSTIYGISDLHKKDYVLITNFVLKVALLTPELI